MFGSTVWKPLENSESLNPIERILKIQKLNKKEV